MASGDTPERTDGNGISAPYVSFATLKNAIEKMGREGGVPSQVDRSYLSNLPGSTQTQLIGAMKWLGLIDDTLTPTSTLEELVGREEIRKDLIGDLLHARYPSQMMLPALATQGQLEQTFREAGLGGSTLRKAVAFFLGAARFAEAPLSPHFKTPPSAPASGADRRPRRTTKPSPSGAGSMTASDAGNTQPLRRHHPLIEGLIQELPEPGANFPQGKQEDWLQLAQVTFRMIYKTDDARQARVEDQPPGLVED